MRALGHFFGAVILLGAGLRQDALAAPTDSPAVPEAAEATAWRSGLILTTEGISSLAGGARNGTRFEGGALGYLEWSRPSVPASDLNLQAYGSVLSLFGRGPSEELLGDFLAASNIEGHHSTRLYSWWLDASTGAWSFRAGALLADEEFTSTEVGGNFINSAFGWPAFVSANTVNTGPAFFVAAAGVRLRRVFDENSYWQLGIYDGDTFDSPAGDPVINQNGLSYHLGGHQGAFGVTEYGFSPDQARTRFKVGGWFHTANFADHFTDETGAAIAETGAAARQHPYNLGGYASIERTLIGQPGEAGNIEYYLRAGASPRDRNPVSWAVDTGIAWTGLVPSRRADVLAIGVVAAKFSSPQDTSEVSLSDFPRGSEMVLELNYLSALSKRITLHPSLQYIRQPGGSRGFNDALVVIVRLETRL